MLRHGQARDRTSESRLGLCPAVFWVKCSVLTNTWLLINNLNLDKHAEGTQC